MTVTLLDDTGGAGAWQLRGFVGDEWQWHVGPHEPPGTPGWIPARVPGSVLDDLYRAGEVPDPYVARGSLLAEWVPYRAWAYRRRFTLDPLGSGERAVLCFDGVDHDATVLVDDVPVARHAGLFRSFEADVTDLVRDGGRHLLAVVVHPARRNEPQVGRTDRVRTHQPRMGYGWDFCPPMIHQGIWRGVRLEVSGPVRLRAATVATALGPGPEGLRDGTVTVAAELSVTGDDGLPEPTRLTVRLRDGDRLVAEDVRALTGPAPEGQVRITLPVPEPRLWWPNGAGEQHLYQVEVSLAAGGHVALRRYPVGFRRIELVRNEGAPDDALPYTLVVNGERCYVNGWNWAPLDAQYGVPRPATLAHLLGLARDAHVNLLRVWGGGLVETEEFYRLCDRLGLLVWQEFALSSSGMASTPAADPEFVRLMVDEARAVVPARRHHPSLAVWCGGNELQDEQGRPLVEAASPVLAALRDTVRALDPGRAWLPSSPSGRQFLHRADVVARDPDGLHDVHGPWEHQGLAEHHALYDAGTCLLHSEFGVEGMTNRRALERLVPADQRWPVGRENPVYAHLGAWWNNASLVDASFGGRLDAVEPVRRASQHLQYDGLRYAVEANRRRAFRNSGTLPWQFHESYPNAWCTAAVDHRGDPKPAYHGVRRAYRPLHVCAAFASPAWGDRDTVTADVWAWGPRPAARVVARIVDVTGRDVARAEWQLEPEPGSPSDRRPCPPPPGGAARARRAEPARGAADAAGSGPWFGDVAAPEFGAGVAGAVGRGQRDAGAAGCPGESPAFPGAWPAGSAAGPESGAADPAGAVASRVPTSAPVPPSEPGSVPPSGAGPVPGESGAAPVPRPVPPSGPGPAHAESGADLGRPVLLGTVSAPLADVTSDVFLIDLALYDREGGAPLVANRYLCSRTRDLAPLLDLAPARVAVTAEPRGQDRTTLRLRHLAGPAALGLVLEDDRPYHRPGWAVFDDNVIDLLPGEEATVDLAWRAAPPDGRLIRLTGWNTEARHAC